MSQHDNSGNPIVRPRRLRLEASSACQLKCPACPTASGEARPVLGVGHLRFDAFRQLIDRNPGLAHVELSNYGELFLNPELPNIMEHAFARGVTLTADNGANLNTVRDETLQALVKFRFRGITCSIDGASQETYVRYRVAGDFNTVIANVRKIQEYKSRAGSRYPRLTWQFISFPHNRHEIETARTLARQMGIQFRLKLPWNEDNPIAGAGLVQIGQGREPASRREYSERYGVNYMRPICRQLWQNPQVNWDGRVLGCCRNFWGEFGGNAFEDGLESIANSERMRYAREMLLGRQPAREDIPCTTCDLYVEMKDTGRWFTGAEADVSPRVLRRLYQAGLGNRFVLMGAGIACRAAEGLTFWLSRTRRQLRQGRSYR